MKTKKEDNIDFHVYQTDINFITIYKLYKDLANDNKTIYQDDLKINKNKIRHLTKPNNYAKFHYIEGFAFYYFFKI